MSFYRNDRVRVTKPQFANVPADTLGTIVRRKPSAAPAIPAYTVRLDSGQEVTLWADMLALVERPKEN